MMNAGQNRQIESISKLALRGKGYSWNSIPISDSQSEDPSFHISQPQESLRQEMLASARRRDSMLLSEAHVPTKENAKAAPRDPYTTPASVVPHEEGEHLSLTNPRPDRFESFAGSGEELLDRLAGMSDEELIDVLDRMSRKKRKRSRDERAPHGANRPSAYVGQSGVMRQEDDEDDRTGREREQHVSNDRAAAFDRAMPLDGEILFTWNGWLRKEISQYGKAMPYFKALTGFLERAKAGRRFCDLSARERDLLGRIVKQIVQTA